jgi:hypothetical protein
MATKFPGALDANRAPRRSGPLDPNADENHAAWAVEDHRNLHLLLQHYGIEEGPDQYYFLAIRLAGETVPCFQEKAREGRPRKWDDYALGVLVVEVDRIIEAGATQELASREIAKRKPWNQMLEQWEEGKGFGPDPGDAILTQYKKGRKIRWSEVLREAFNFHETTGTVHEWDANILRDIPGNN